MLKKIFIVAVYFIAFSGFSNAELSYPFLGKMTAVDVNLRSGQSVSFQSLGQLNQGEKIVVADKSFSWYKIRLPQRISCFISSKFVERKTADIGMVAGSRVNIRSGKGTEYSILGQAKEGTLLKIIKADKDWFEIQPTPDCFGWVHEQFVKFESNQVPAPEIVRLPTRNVYEQRRQRQSQKKKTEVQKKKQKTAQQKQKKEDVFTAVGYIKDLGRVVADRNIRYKLVIQGKTAYYLLCPRHVIDHFVNYKAQIQGQIKEDPDGEYSYPVIVVKKIRLVL